MTKKKWFVWAVIGAALLACFFIVRSCRVTDTISKLKGQLAEAQHQADIDRNALVNAEKVHNDDLAKIASLRASSEHLEGISAGLGAKIGEKDAEIELLEKERQGLKDLPAIVANQAKEITTLKENLSLERSDKAAIAKDRENWRTIASTWESNAKYYQAEVEKWKVQDDKDRRALEIAQSIVGKQATRISWLQLKGNLETAVIVAAAAYLGYSILKPAKAATPPPTPASLKFSIRF